MTYSLQTIAIRIVDRRPLGLRISKLSYKKLREVESPPTTYDALSHSGE